MNHVTLVNTTPALMAVSTAMRSGTKAWLRSTFGSTIRNLSFCFRPRTLTVARKRRSTTNCQSSAGPFDPASSLAPHSDRNASGSLNVAMEEGSYLGRLLRIPTGIRECGEGAFPPRHRRPTAQLSTPALRGGAGIGRANHVVLLSGIAFRSECPHVILSSQFVLLAVLNISELPFRGGQTFAQTGVDLFQNHHSPRATQETTATLRTPTWLKQRHALKP